MSKNAPSEWARTGAVLIVIAIALVCLRIFSDIISDNARTILLVAGVIAIIAGLLFLGIGRDQPLTLSVRASLSDREGWPLPRFGLEDSSQLSREAFSPILRGLDKGVLRLDPYSEAAMPIESLAWVPGNGFSSYFAFNLHTLRFIVHIWDRGEETRTPQVKACLELLNSWNRSNPFDSAPKFHECFRGCVDNASRFNRGVSIFAWADEHAVSLRTIVIANLARRCAAENVDEDVRLLLDDLAEAHGRYIVQQSNYRYEHNHGLNNAMALVALGIVFRDHLRAGYWLGLGMHRAEQQMRDNVSDEGVHLEQSGFYHFYTLRTFLDILYAVQFVGLDMTEQYKAKLGRMFDVAAWMLESDGAVHSLPYSDSRISMRNFLNGKTLELADLGLANACVQRFKQRLDGGGLDGLQVWAHGGFAIRRRSYPKDLSILLHTRTLFAGHAHDDPLGVVVINDGQELISKTSGLRIPTTGTWEKYFHSAESHNTVLMLGKSLEIAPKSSRKDLLSRVMHSYKIGTLAWRLGLMDHLIALRRILSRDIIPLASRSVAQNGELLFSHCSGEWAGVLARHCQYPDCEHLRGVVEVGGIAMVIWDRLSASSESTFRQVFHLDVGVSAAHDGNRAVLTKNGLEIGSAWQVSQHAVRVADETSSGWKSVGGDEQPAKIEKLVYEAQGTVCNFFFVLSLGSHSEVEIVEQKDDCVFLRFSRSRCVVRVECTNNELIVNKQFY